MQRLAGTPARRADTVVDHGDWVKTLAVYPRRERPNPPIYAWSLPNGGVRREPAAPRHMDGRRHCAKGIAVVGSHDTAAAVRLTVGVIGLGLIGGSLARRLAIRGVSVVAWNHRPHPYAQAEADGIFCKSTLSELMDAEPDVVVLCNPLKAMPAILAALAPLMGDHPNTTLTDVGSVKGMVRDQVKAAGWGSATSAPIRWPATKLSAGRPRPHLYDGALWAITVDEFHGLPPLPRRRRDDHQGRRQPRHRRGRRNA